ncbi:MAG: acetyltransferase [Terriglobia bacterium]
MSEVVLLGAAGHAKVIIEIFQETRAFEVVGCLSPQSANAAICGIPILGDDRELDRLLAKGVRRAFVAVGENRRRAALCKRVQEIGFELVNAISSHATVSPSVRLGQGIAVMPGAVLNAETIVSDGSIINTGATVDHDCFIGAYSHIAPGSNLAGSVRVGSGAFLGTGSRVIPNIRIGEWSTVGAGAVVIADVPPRVTAVGVPARIKDRKNEGYKSNEHSSDRDAQDLGLPSLVCGEREEICE